MNDYNNIMKIILFDFTIISQAQIKQYMRNRNISLDIKVILIILLTLSNSANLYAIETIHELCANKTRVFESDNNQDGIVDARIDICNKPKKSASLKNDSDLLINIYASGWGTHSCNFMTVFSNASGSYKGQKNNCEVTLDWQGNTIKSAFNEKCSDSYCGARAYFTPTTYYEDLVPNDAKPRLTALQGDIAICNTLIPTIQNAMDKKGRVESRQLKDRYQKFRKTAGYPSAHFFIIDIDNNSIPEIATTYLHSFPPNRWGSFMYIAYSPNEKESKILMSKKRLSLKKRRDISEIIYSTNQYNGYQSAPSAPQLFSNGVTLLRDKTRKTTYQEYDSTPFRFNNKNYMLIFDYVTESNIHSEVNIIEIKQLQPEEYINICNINVTPFQYQSNDKGDK